MQKNLYRQRKKERTVRKIYVDGGTRHSNICLVDGENVHLRRRGNGELTNNELEYLAMLFALEYIRSKYPDEKVTVYSDSKLIVNQINGGWRVTTKTLRPYYEKCVKKLSDNIKIIWISRDFNLAGHVLEK
jgi:ribonuclease HI